VKLTRILIAISVLLLANWVAVIGAQVATPSPTTTPTATPTATATPEPCFVGGEDTLVRVGPGTNRGVLTFLPDDALFQVVGTARDQDDALWYRLDKENADFPAFNAANEVWVAAEGLETAGDCEALEVVPTPQVILFVTATPTPRTRAGQAGNDGAVLTLSVTPGPLPPLSDIEVAQTEQSGASSPLSLATSSALEANSSLRLTVTFGYQPGLTGGTAPADVDLGDFGSRFGRAPSLVTPTPTLSLGD
jgi:hypothetical protein